MTTANDDDAWAVLIRQAWATIEVCRHRDPDDGTCGHPDNPTPECHGPVCPLVKS